MQACVLQSLFSPTSGAGISLVRISIGGSDFASTKPFTDETTPGTFKLSSDDLVVIDVLKKAEQINPNIQVIAAPWTAPPWMKSNESYIGGSLKSADQKDYASYFVDFIKAYEADGITINYVTPQNEPGDSTNDPSMVMSASGESTFVDQYLSPALRGLSTKILAYDWNWDTGTGTCPKASECWSESEIKSVLKGAPSNVAGIGWHCYSVTAAGKVGSATSQSLFQGSLHGSDPLQIMDECTGTGPNGPSQSAGTLSQFKGNLNWDSKNLVITALNNFGSGIQFWNLALPMYPYTPPSGSCKNCRGVITVTSRSSVQFNVEYYILKALADSIEAGSTHVHTVSSNPSVITSTASSNLDGSTGLYVENESKVSSITVVDGDDEFTYLGGLPADSVVSFKWHRPPAAAAGHVVGDGYGYCALLTSGEVDCWGSDEYGDLGNGNGTSSATPVQVVGVNGSGVLNDVTNLVADDYGGSYCALLTTSEVDCWGYGFPEFPGRIAGVNGAGSLTGVASLASDSYGAFCAVLKTGGVDCWGYGPDGQLGNGVLDDSSSTPVSVLAVGGSGTLANVVSLAGSLGFCAVLTSSQVDCWGDDIYGDLGDGVTTNNGGGSGVPVRVVGVGGTGVLTDVGSVVSDGGGGGGYCALLEVGAADCWGGGNYGELGNGVFYPSGGSSVPVQVVGVGDRGVLAGVASLTGDGDSTGYCALLVSGGVACWGYGYNGQLGNGSYYESGNAGSAVPVQVVGVGGTGTLSQVVDLVEGPSDGGSCALLQSGSVDCWGYGWDGELGNGVFYETGSLGSATPVKVLGVGRSGTLGKVSSLADASTWLTSHCALLKTGRIDCWGDGNGGDLGNGDLYTSGVAGSALPVKVVGVGGSGTLGGA
jgi:O-glycosyl hydrolase/alpha-tubulin suppressor-like RCC1 family protein